MEKWLNSQVSLTLVNSHQHVLFCHSGAPCWTWQHHRVRQRWLATDTHAVLFLWAVVQWLQPSYFLLFSFGGWYIHLTTVTFAWISSVMIYQPFFLLSGPFWTHPHGQSLMLWYDQWHDNRAEYEYFFSDYESDIWSNCWVEITSKVRLSWTYIQSLSKCT